MPLSIPAKDDLMQTVYIELERMFTVLRGNDPEESNFFREVEAEMKLRLKQFRESFHDSSPSE
jgi:hypothetical protein